MADPFYYFGRTDLDNALGKKIVESIFDDNMDGVADDAPVKACCAYGTSQAKSFLRNLYPDGLPTTSNEVSDELKFCALDFGISYTMRRRPDLVRAMGEESWSVFLEKAIDQMKRYIESMQRMPTPPAPNNVGGEVITPSAEATATPPCEVPEPVFSDMGDF